MPSTRGRVGLVCAAVLLTLASAELLLRFRPVELQHDWLLRPGNADLDPDLIYVKPAHKDPAYYRRREGLPNLIALGDSFTAGFPVGAERSYPTLLERMLAESGVSMNVINLGTGDSGPDQHLRLFEKIALELVRPDVVVWQLYTNDVWDNVEKAVFTIEAGHLVPISARTNWLYWRQRIFELTPLPASVKRESAVYRYFLKAFEHWMLAQVPAPYEKDAWALAKMKLEIEEMERLGKERGFRTYYVVVPPQATYLDEPGRDEIRDVMKYDVDVRDLVRELPGFIDVRFEPDGAKPVADRFFAEEERDHNRYGDRHLNEDGYRVLARQVAERVLTDWQGRAEASSARPAVR